jgi:hypothetical protein
VEILKRFDINPPTTDERFLQHAEVDRGIKATIEGYSDPRFGKCIRVTVGSTVVTRQCSLTDSLAQDMAKELRDHQAIPDIEALSHTLAHLLRQCSTMYEKSGIDTFALGPVYLTQRGYRIVGVAMERTAPLHVHKRLSSDAHDRKAQFPYRRTERKPGK